MSDYISKEKALAIFIEGAPDDNDFTLGYNFAVNEYREKIKAMKSTNEICIICGHKIHYDTETYYDINGAAVCDGCMFTVCEVKPIKDGVKNE